MRKLYKRIEDPLGNRGFLLQKGTDKEPFFIIRKPSISKPAEMVEKEVRRELKPEPNGHEIDEKAIARSVANNWRDYYGSHKE